MFPVSAPFKLLLAWGLLGVLTACQAVQSFLPEQSREVRRTSGEGVAADGIRWSDVTELDLTVSSEQDPPSHWQFTFATGNELLIKVDESYAGQNNQGSIILIQGNTMLVSGFEPDPNNAIGALDRPVLSYQLVTRLLEKLFPNGPAQVRGREEIDFGEDDVVISIGTVSDSRSYGVPWEVVGYARREGRNRVRFDMNFRFSEKRMTAASRLVNFKGVWRYQKSRPELSGHLAIADYRLYSFQPSTRVQAGIGIASYEARLETEVFDLLHQARSYVKNSGR